MSAGPSLGGKEGFSRSVVLYEAGRPQSGGRIVTEDGGCKKTRGGGGGTMALSMCHSHYEEISKVIEAPKQ